MGIWCLDDVTIHMTCDQSWVDDSVTNCLRKKPFAARPSGALCGLKGPRTSNNNFWLPALFEDWPCEIVERNPRNKDEEEFGP